MQGYMYVSEISKMFSGSNNVYYPTKTAPRACWYHAVTLYDWTATFKENQAIKGQEAAFKPIFSRKLLLKASAGN